MSGRVRTVGGLGPRFRRLWAATAVSSVGDGLAFVAVPLLAARSTGDPRLVAGVAAAGRLPWLLVGLPAGTLADRLPRAAALRRVEAARAVVVALVAVGVALGASPIAGLFAAAFILGSLETLFSALIHGGVPELVADDHLELANSRLYTVESAGLFFVGPAVGGVLFVAGRSLPFALDAVTFIASGLLLFAAFSGVTRREDLPAPPGRRRDGIAEGLRYFVHAPAVRVLTATITAFALFQAVATATLVLYTLHRLHVGVAGYGLFVTVTALGDVGGGLLAGRFAGRLPARAVVVGAGVVSAACYLALGAAPTIGVAIPALIAEGAAVAVANVASVGLRQRLIPKELLGRVGNTIRVIIFGAVPAGALLGGLIAARLGYAAPLLVAGAGQLLVLLIVAPRLLAGDHPGRTAGPVQSAGPPDVGKAVG